VAIPKSAPLGSPQSIANEVGLPYRLEGFPFIPEQKASFIYRQILANANLSEFFLLDHFKKIFNGTLHATATGDKEFLEEYLHPRLAARMLHTVDALKQRDLSVNLSAKS
jgi:peptide subunit release factor 1 (eRF1)